MKLKGLLKVALVLLAVSSLFVACDTIAGGKWPRVEKVYMKPSEDWADGRFAVWFWETGKEGSFTDMKASTEYEGLYEVNVPAGVDNVIFVKMSADSKENKWDNKEAQTDDLQVPILGDGGAVYSITAKQWIELGAKEPEPEPEPEKPVAVAISATEFTSLKYAASSNPTDIKLDADKSFTFYANSKTYKFKYTDGTWAFAAVTGEAITELGKEYPIVKKGDTGYDNIELKNLTAGAEYKVTLTHKDGFAYVKVEATGNVKEVELDKLTADELAKVTHIAGDMNSWSKTALTENSYLFKAGSKYEFLILDGTDSWDFKLGSAIIEELDVEYPLFKGGDNITFEEGVLAKDKNYLITVVIKESVVYVKVTASEEEIPDPFKGKTISYAGTMTVVGSDWTHIALGETKSFDFYANGIDDAFKFTAGNWTDVQAGSATINALNTKVELKTGTSGIGNITFASGVLTRNSGYKATYTFENGKAYVTVTATGTINPDPLPDLETFVPVAGKVYLKPSDNWKEGSANFAAYFYVDSDSEWVKMTKSEGLGATGIFECEIPTAKNYTKVIFVRHDPTVEPNFSWGQTADLDIKQGPENYYEVIGWNAEGSGWREF